MATESRVKQALKCCLFFASLALFHTLFSSLINYSIESSGGFHVCYYLFVFSFVLSLTLVRSHFSLLLFFSLMHSFVLCSILMFSMHVIWYISYFSYYRQRVFCFLLSLVLVSSCDFFLLTQQFPLLSFFLLSAFLTAILSQVVSRRCL